MTTALFGLLIVLLTVTLAVAGLLVVHLLVPLSIRESPTAAVRITVRIIYAAFYVMFGFSAYRVLNR